MRTSVLRLLLACARKADTSGLYYMVQRTLLYNSHLLSVVSYYVNCQITSRDKLGNYM